MRPRFHLPRRAALLSTIAAVLTALPARAGLTFGKEALVIGNGAYRAISPLRNPNADAAAVGAALRRIGFNTIVLTDALSATTATSLAAFAGRLDPTGIGLLYFSGHATGSTSEHALSGNRPDDWRERNATYLIPTDLSESSYQAVMAEALEIGEVMDALRKVRTGIYVNDTHLFTTGERIPPGVLLASAVPPNGIALDGDGETSPFVGALVRALAVADLDTDQLFALAARLTAEATGGAEVPWIVNRLRGQVVLNRPDPTR